MRRDTDPAGSTGMRTQFTVGDMTIHRIVEQEHGFTPLFEFLPTLSKERFEENRSWMEQGAYDPKTGNVVLCFQSYVVKTPHHNILVDACVGNNKSFPHRPAWHNKSDGNWMAALKAAGLGVEDIDFVMGTHLHADHFAVCAGKGGDQAVFTGDLIHSPIQARYPELVMRVDTDRDQGAATRRRFFERYCDTDTLCCTMHFPSPSVGHVKRWDNGFRLEYGKG